ncbi:hypothetical protein RLW55_09970 [Hyphomicrobium sp. B1]|uniref:hypothetical protein n=1 Tax=Hyphomicrobium sp. B1 TaxID=3075651 RepID=UPI003C2CB376
MGKIDDMGERDEGPAAGFVIFASQATKAVRIVAEMDMTDALSIDQRLVATRTARSARFILVTHSIEWHETFPRKIPSQHSGWHDIGSASKSNLVAACGQSRQICEEMKKAAVILLGGRDAFFA